MKGSKLMLAVVDANGSSGGVPPRLYTVNAGQSTSCIPNRQQNSFTISANISDTAQTCDPWGMTITGGIRPYTVTLAALNSPVMTNVTMGANDDRFTYINRADPGTTLLAAVSDVTGRYASGTATVKTAGSTNVDCIGLVTSSGNSTVIQQQMEEAARKADDDRRRRQVITGVCAAVGVIAGLALAAAAYWYYRRRNRQRQELEEAQPRKFEDSNGHEQYVSAIAFPHDASPSHSRSPKSAELSGSSVALMHAQYADAATFDPYQQTSNTESSRPHSDSTSSSGAGAGLSSRPSFAAFPTSSRRYNKAAEAGFRPSSSGSGSQRPMSSDGSSQVGSSSYPPTTHLLDDQPEIIIQHRDGGPTVRELPPPYADRGQRQG
ncbi:hypothetical protein ONZ45_g994 [Pleurotus djamor]|nr:hypothetical protein ONZ45_g994 [Pleurotus djamor]